MTRSMMLLVRLVVLLWCFLVVADLAASTAAARDTDVAAGVGADSDNPNKLLDNNHHHFVDTNDRFNDVLENNLKSYLFNNDDLCNNGNRMTTPDDHVDLVDDNLTNDKAPGNQLTFTNVDGNDYPTYATNSFVDFTTLMEGQNIANGNYTNGIKMKTSTNLTKIIHQQQVTLQQPDTKEWLMTKRNSQSHDNHTRHHDAIGKVSSHQRRRHLQSCVSSASGLARAVKQASTTQTSSIKVCTPRISVGGLNRRRRLRRTRQRRLLQSNNSLNGTNVTLTGLAGGIDFSNRSITFTCILKQRCILDGEGISRIFYGTNAIITIDGFQFLNASSKIGDTLGSGSALTVIGSSQVTIRDCSFVANNAPSVGGAIMIYNSTLTLKNSRRKTQFIKNQASYGGAIFGLRSTIQTNITTSSSSLSSFALQDNYAVQATIQTNVATSSSSSSYSFAFQENYALNDGGAVYVLNSTVIWDQITLEKNDATNGGAAVFVDTNVTMDNMYVFGNEAKQTGGAFVFVRANVVINDSNFDANNGNGTVDAITSTSSSVQVNDATFSRSRWYVDSSTTLNLTNSCLPQGSNCVLGSTCSDCCQPYISWSTKVGYYCGPNPRNVKKCFGSDGTELRNAVVKYASGDSNIIANLTSIYGNISDWCTSSVTAWSNMLNGLSSFNENISNWDTSKATSMASMFYGASSFNQDISKWDTSKVGSMLSMFRDATSFNQDISKWNTSKVTFMDLMFYNAASFNQDLSKWDTSRVGSMAQVFYLASSFNQDVSTWDVSKVLDMTSMFLMTPFNQDISKWDTSKVKFMQNMFSGNKNFNGNISMWKVSQVSNMKYMFSGASSFNQDISRWNTTNVVDMQYMFFNASSFNQDMSTWDTSNVKIMDYMFSSASNFNGNITTWNVSQVSTMNYMFSSATSFNQDISGWVISKLTQMSRMFNGATSFNQNISIWDISKVSQMNSMMLGATAFNQSLCAWKNKCGSWIPNPALNVFSGTSCPNQANPFCGTGPFCYTCP